MSNIFNHNRFPFEFKLNKSEYWDLFLSADNFGAISQYDNADSLVDHCLISYIDTNDGDCIWFDSLYSKEAYKWDEAINNGLDLNNIGFTGMDNGLITFEKDKTSNKEFIELFTNSEYKIEEGDNRLILNKVCGNNEIYDYSNCLTTVDNMIVSALGGGFFQGFYKSGCDYDLLPHNVGNGMCLEFVIRRNDSVKEEDTYTLNDCYPDNKGIFFYMGTRAENKWWKKYDTKTAFDDIAHEYFGDDYIADAYLTTAGYSNEYINNDAPTFLVSDYFDSDYVNEEYFDSFCETDDCNDKNGSYENQTETKPCEVKWKYPEALNTYQENAIWQTTCGGVWIENEKWTSRYRFKYGCNEQTPESKPTCSCNYFSDDYFKNEPLDCKTCFPGYMDESYFAVDVDLDPNETLFTKDGVELDQANVYDITTDNKFLLFDRTCNGFTVDNWVEGTEITIRDVKGSPQENYFLLFDRTCHGLTVDSNLNKLVNNTYNVMNDIYRNAFALQIKDDGSIGYKYIVQDCDADNGYSILSEFSYEDVIPYDEWATVHVRIEPLGKIYNAQTLTTSSEQKVRLMFYVNGRLVMVSKEIPTFNFRELNDTPDKQEGVPFNISLGGGTQGLCDVVYYDYRKTPNKVLTLEKEFGGSFIGYFKSFKMYDCRINFSEVVQNYMFEKNNIEENKIFIK